MGARLRVAATVLGIVAPASCAPSSGERAISGDGTASPVRPGDPAYAMTALHDTPVGDYGVLPHTLAEALPNHRLVLQGRTEDHIVRFSRALVSDGCCGRSRGRGRSGTRTSRSRGRTSATREPTPARSWSP
jgi:hypothetical protein